jgi:ABC-2 type transport system permease protein
MTTTTLTSAGPPATRSSDRTVRSVHADTRAVGAALHSEWIKVSSVRTNRVILALTVIVGVVASWGVATFVTDEVLTVAEVYVYSTFLTAVIAAVAGILQFSSEAQHGTLAIALTAQPARWVLAAAKAIVAIAVGVVLGAAGMAAGFVGAVLGGLAMGDTAGMVATTAWALLFTALAAVLGLGVGMVVRHSSGAISGLLVWWLVVENLVWFALPASVSRFLPFYAGDALLGVETDTATPETIAVALTRSQDALLFAAYAVLALGVGTALLYRRDTN